MTGTKTTLAAAILALSSVITAPAMAQQRTNAHHTSPAASASETLLIDANTQPLSTVIGIGF